MNSEIKQSVWGKKGGVDVLKSNEHVGMKFNQDLDQWVKHKKIPHFGELPDGSLELQFPYDYVVDGRVYRSVELLEKNCDYVTYWDNEKQKFWSRWETKV